MTPTVHLVCPLCGGPNDCALACGGSFDTPCWCGAGGKAKIALDPATLARVPHALRGTACICPQCAGGALAWAPK